MDQHAELGVAAHWRYKEGGNHDVGYQRKLNWMRQLLESSGEEADETLLDEFGGEGSDERIYALTPRGQVIDLRAGSTVLDFAYHIHTDVGHRCRGAKVNGRIVPLTYALKNGEQVEVLTGKTAQPSRDWLLTRAGYLKSSRARGKVRQWFKRMDHERNLAEGKEILDKELKRLAASASDLEPILDRFHKKSIDSLYVAVASGDVTSGQVASALEDLRQPEDEEVLPLARSIEVPRSAKDDVIIEGVGNLMTSLARCCSPLPGDPISGYITRNRGVSIHRQDCKNALRLVSSEPERMLEVAWGGHTHDRYKAQLLIMAYERKGLIRDIGEMLLHCHSDVLAINTRVDEKMGRVEIDLSVRVSDFEHLGFVLNRISSIPNVYETRRVG
jgi:GTP pyrophosphokinase